MNRSFLESLANSTKKEHQYIIKIAQNPTAVPSALLRYSYMFKNNYFKPYYL